MDPSLSASSLALSAAGSVRGVLDAVALALGAGSPATLALTLSCSGSTYVRPGAMALFGADGAQAGWLSGGCLEPEIATRARQALEHARIEWLELDTRPDEDLLAGSAIGCRGRLRLALLPLSLLHGLVAPVDAWRRGAGELGFELQAGGAVSVHAGDACTSARVPAAPLPWAGDESAWHLRIAPPLRVLVCGAGPETPALLPLLRTLGMHATLLERRPRWRALGVYADAHLEVPPGAALRAAHYDAALVMHHHFELDRETLAALAGCPIGFVGLLGPVRRREDLFRVLPGQVRDALAPRLHSPVGLALGGEGPEAIAVSIAAQLQQQLQPQPAR